MKFVCDVHLSYKLVKFLNNAGCDALHANELPNKWESSDDEIALLADKEGRIVVTKDKDFFNSHMLGRSPAKLIRLTSGNISNQLILEIFQKWLPVFAEMNKEARFCVEINEDGIFTY